MESLLSEDEPTEDDINNLKELDHGMALVDEARAKVQDQQNKNVDLIEEAKVQIEKEQVIQVQIPIDQLLKSNRNQRKLYFAALIKEIKGELEIVRIKRSIGKQ